MSGVSIALIIFASGFAMFFAALGFVVAAAMIAALRSEREERKGSQRGEEK